MERKVPPLIYEGGKTNRTADDFEQIDWRNGMELEYKETFLFYESYGKTFERLRQIDKEKAD